MTIETLEQRVAYLEAELERINKLLQVNPTINFEQTQSNHVDLPFGIFANDGYFDEVVQRIREERELDTDNPAYT